MLATKFYKYEHLLKYLQGKKEKNIDLKNITTFRPKLLCFLYQTNTILKAGIGIICSKIIHFNLGCDLTK